MLSSAVLDPEVELHSGRGLRKGVEAARVWATRAPGGVQQTIELEQLYEEGTESGGGTAVALIVRRWHWDEDGTAAGEDEMAWVLRAARRAGSRSWRPFEDRAEALLAGGFPNEARAAGVTCGHGRGRLHRIDRRRGWPPSASS